MKNSLKRVFSALAVSAVAVSAASMTSFAADNTDPLDGLDSAAVSNAPIQPKLTIGGSTVLAASTDAQEVEISINVTDGAGYASTGIHLYYDSRLELAKDEDGDFMIQGGSGISKLNGSLYEIDQAVDQKGFSGVFLTTAATENKGKDGDMWNITFVVPAGAEAGTVYPIDLYYRANPQNEKLTDMFTPSPQDVNITAWTFANGIYNKKYNNNFAAAAEDVAKCANLAKIDASYDGYIAIEGAPVVTTTTATTIATTTTTTATTTVDTTTATTVASTSATTKASTSAASTSKKAVTTGKGNSPQTGVAGAGVAVAGLAVAIGTAFVLRKKED